MKKSILSVFLVFCLFIGVNTISAKGVKTTCHYKTNDEKITIAVLKYDDGSAIGYTTKPFSKQDGFIAKKELGESWKIGNNSKDVCDQYLLLNLNNNSIVATSSNSTSGNNEYILETYEFDTGVTTCKYQKMYNSTLVNYTIWVNNKSIFYNFDNGLKGDDDNYENVMGEYEYPNTNTIFGKDSLIPVSTFYNDFMNNFYSNTGDVSCPSLTLTKSTGGVNFFSATTGSGTAFDLIDASYSNNVGTGKIVAEHRVNFLLKESQTTVVNFIFRAYQSKKEEICIEVDKRIKSCIKLPLSSEDGFHEDVYLSENNWFLYFGIKPEEARSFFVYGDLNDPSTLKSPEPLYFNPTTATSFQLSKTQKNNSIVGNASAVVSGGKYQDLVGKLCPLLKANKNYSDILTKNQLTGGSLIEIQSCSVYNGKIEDLQYNTEVAVKNLANYCTDLYSNYSRYQNFSSINSRIDECINFNTFYGNLMKSNVIRDLGSDCPFITPALGEKLQFVLDILKIAAPILALALSTLDFVKTIAAGDADKESKSAFKRFGIRIGSAILLFIIPVILAFLLDLFLENQEGYDGSNPFCNLVDLSDKK